MSSMPHDIHGLNRHNPAESATTEHSLAQRIRHFSCYDYCALAVLVLLLIDLYHMYN